MQIRFLAIVTCVVALALVAAAAIAAEGPAAPSAGPSAAAPSLDSSGAAVRLESSAPAAKEREVVLFSDQGRVFPLMLADPREAYFRLGFGRTNAGRAIWDTVLGGDVTLARIKEPDGLESSLSIRGLAAPRFVFANSTAELENADFRGGLAYGWAKGPRAYEVFFYHESSHLGDQLMEQGATRINYSREVLRFLASQHFGPLWLYAGPSVVTRHEPSSIDGRVILQGGGVYAFKAWGQDMYAALDLQSKEENDWAANANAQVGIELGDPNKVKNRHRVFVEFFTGHSNMGQFYNRTETIIFLGVAYTLK